MKPLVLAEYLSAIKRVIATGETDLSDLNARLLNKGEHVQFKQGRSWVSVRVDALPGIIKALKEKGALPVDLVAGKR
jgi:hypothetical protein